MGSASSSEADSKRLDDTITTLGKLQKDYEDIVTGMSSIDKSNYLDKTTFDGYFNSMPSTTNHIMTGDDMNQFATIEFSNDNYLKNATFNGYFSPNIPSDINKILTRKDIDPYVENINSSLANSISAGSTSATAVSYASDALDRVNSMIIPRVENLQGSWSRTCTTPTGSYTGTSNGNFTINPYKIGPILFCSGSFSVSGFNGTTTIMLISTPCQNSSDIKVTLNLVFTQTPVITVSMSALSGQRYGISVNDISITPTNVSFIIRLHGSEISGVNFTIMGITRW